MQAFARGIVNAEVCELCQASADVVASSVSEIFVSAVAEAEVNVQGSGNADATAQAFARSVAVAIVTAYAEV